MTSDKVKNGTENTKSENLETRRAMGQCLRCLDNGKKQQRKEEERLASVEARAKAAEAAQKRQEQFDKSAAGRAARAQLAANAKQSANAYKGEPVLKWSMG